MIVTSFEQLPGNNARRDSHQDQNREHDG